MSSASACAPIPDKNRNSYTLGSSCPSLVIATTPFADQPRTLPSASAIQPSPNQSSEPGGVAPASSNAAGEIGTKLPVCASSSPGAEPPITATAPAPTLGTQRTTEG